MNILKYNIKPYCDKHNEMEINSWLIIVEGL